MPPLRTASIRAFHGSGGADVRGGVAQHQLLDAGRRRAPPSHMPIMPPIDRPQKRTRSMPSASSRPSASLAEQRDRVRARRDRRGAVAAAVVAQHAELPRERRHLRVPHREVGAERVGQHQHRRRLPVRRTGSGAGLRSLRRTASSSLLRQVGFNARREHALDERLRQADIVRPDRTGARGPRRTGACRTSWSSAEHVAQDAALVRRRAGTRPRPDDAPAAGRSCRRAPS